MYIQECFSEDLREEILQALKFLGIKSTLKKLNSKINLNSSSKRIFQTSLLLLEKQSVILRHSGVLVSVPTFLINTCNHLRLDLGCEGIFRKAGSIARQKELRAKIENGGSYCSDDHVIDVANILKWFLRELPEPLIPAYLHEILLKCLILKGKETETVLMSCLLLPIEHLDCLIYLIEFLNEVVALKEQNKMSSINLAIVFAPNVMPFNSTSNMDHYTSSHTKIMKILLENACLLGSVPDFICEKLSLETPTNQRKRRNSGSLTRMFSGLKKMVGKVSSSASDSHLNNRVVLGTPNSSNPTVPVLSAKKRKVPDVSTPFSLKKRREVLRCLPEESILPKSPMVLSNKFSSQKSVPDGSQKVSNFRCSEPHYVDGDQKHEYLNIKATPQSGCKSFSGSSLRLSKLSNISQRKSKSKKFNKSSSHSALTDELLFKEDLKTTSRLAFSSENCHLQYKDEGFVQVPKSEFEDLKSRISDIESTISSELLSIGVSLSDSDISQEEVKCSSKANHVQSQYEKTLQQTERLADSAADNIAQHLSRELKIRHSSEGKRVMRSPSQRKIGSIRRRSREGTPVKRDLSRHMSLNLNKNKGPQLYRSRSLQRGRPNTILTGLSHPVIVKHPVKVTRSSSNQLKNKPMPPSIHLKNASVISSKPVSQLKEVADIKKADSIWSNANTFLSENPEKMSYLLPSDRRESIQKIRSLNAGMVLEKTKLYNNIADQTSSMVPRRTKSTGHFKTQVNLNGNEQFSHTSLDSTEFTSLGVEKLDSQTHQNKENVSASDVTFLGTPTSYKSRYYSLDPSKNSAKKKRVTKINHSRHLLRSQSDRSASSPYKTVITIGCSTPRRSPRLNDSKKH